MCAEFLLEVPKSRSPGSRYAGEGRVEIEDFSDGEFTGSVRGSGRHTYSVSLAVPDEEAEGYREVLYADCECPHFDRVGAGCKHLWALILEIDQSGLWTGAPGSEDLDLVDSDDTSVASWEASAAIARLPPEAWKGLRPQSIVSRLVARFPEAAPLLRVEKRLRFLGS